jgi:hypothetical protein
MMSIEDVGSAFLGEDVCIHVQESVCESLYQFHFHLE